MLYSKTKILTANGRKALNRKNNKRQNQAHWSKRVLQKGEKLQGESEIQAGKYHSYARVIERELVFTDGRSS